jgi:hypothetical protein
MHKGPAGERGQDVSEDDLVPGHLGSVGRIPLLHGFVVDHDGDLFPRCLLDAKKVFKLHGFDGWQHLGTSEWVIGFGQLLANGNGKNGANGGHDARTHRRSLKFFCGSWMSRGLALIPCKTWKK